MYLSESGKPPQGDFISKVNGYVALSLSESGKPLQGDFHSGWLCELCLCQNRGCFHRVILYPQWMVILLCLCQNQECLHRVILFPQWMVILLCFCQNHGDLAVFTEHKPFIIVKYAQPLPVRAPGPVSNSSVQFNDPNYISRLNSTIPVIRTTFPDKSTPPFPEMVNAKELTLCVVKL